MPHHVFRVDFNEMVDASTVLLSVGGTKVDASGVSVQLREGMAISVCMDENGDVDKLVASGVVVRNTAADWSAHVKWCCRIDEHGVRTQSEDARSNAG